LIIRDRLPDAVHNALAAIGEVPRTLPQALRKRHAAEMVLPMKGHGSPWEICEGRLSGA